jgi:hypothetical protein
MNIELRPLLASLAALSLVLGACAAESEPDDDVGEVVDESSSALANTSGTGLTSNQCTSCGCTLEKISGPDGNGCRTYRCVCDSEAKAKCVTGKTALPSRATLNAK